MPETDQIAVFDHGTLLCIPFEACVAYHGRTSIGGVALGFRLLQHAFARLSPDAPPDRARLSFFTAFPGPGLRDAVEMVTRAVSRNAYVVDPAAAVQAPEGVRGRMYFEVALDDTRLRLALVEGALSAEFIALGRICTAGTPSNDQRARWGALKEELASTIMASAAADLFVELYGPPAAR